MGRKESIENFMQRRLKETAMEIISKALPFKGAGKKKRSAKSLNKEKPLAAIPQKADWMQTPGKSKHWKKGKAPTPSKKTHDAGYGYAGYAGSDIISRKQ